jgi:tRNA pseudouridine32 synthase/23S rRNA pseudouridine746 synthase/23S rRNA pseudouridine1911/1915/1917 synthase
MSQLTVLEVLQNSYPDSSKTTLRSWLAEGRIVLGEKVVKDPRCTVLDPSLVKLLKKKQYTREGIEILHADPHILVIYKPAGLLSVPTETDLLTNAHEYLKNYFKRRTIYPVHRIDREVSGVMMFAFTEQAQEQLKDQFESHSIEREYFAVVEGDVLQEQGSWQSYLMEDGVYYVRSVKEPSRGKLSTTHYQVLAKKNGTSTLKVTLETGRKNQIRVHTSEAGFPILGDTKYHSKREFHGRVALQAYKLGICHPVDDKPMVFTRELDPEFTPFLRLNAGS